MHHEHACCVQELCCGLPAKRVEALVLILKGVAGGPGKYDELAGTLWDQRVVRQASVFVAPSFASVDQLAAFLANNSREPHRFEAMATALLDQGFLVSVSEFIWPPVLAELREGLECIGIPYDGVAPIVQEAPPEPVAEPEPVVEPVEELVVPPKPKTRPKATPKKVVQAKKK